MCLESFELVKEDIGEVVGWKVFDKIGNKLFPWAQKNGRAFLLEEWNEESDFRQARHNLMETQMDGTPWGFMTFMSRENAEDLCCIDREIIKKVRLRGVVAIGQQEVGYSTYPCYIAKELMIVDEVEHGR